MLRLIVLVTVVALVATSLLVAWRSGVLRQRRDRTDGVHSTGHEGPENRQEP